jgi:hypothetical protein
MSRTIAIPFAMLVGWSLYCVVWAQEPTTNLVKLPPSVSVSAEEAEIEGRLTWPIMLEAHDESIATVVARIGEMHGLDVWLDTKALADAAIDPSVLLNFKTRRPLPLGDALELMLDNFELTYVIQHGVLKITSKERADSIVTTRVYPVEDLVTSATAVNAPYMPPAKSNLNYGPLIQMIEDTIAPDSWDTNSGVGSIKPFRAPGGPAMVISNTLRVQFEVAALFADLRAMKQLPGVPQTPRLSKSTKTITKSYDLGKDSGPDMANTIIASIAPRTWQVHGGAGLIWAAPKKTGKQAGQGKEAIASTNAASDSAETCERWTLVVTQTADVQQQIEDMLTHRNAPEPPKGPIAVSDRIGSPVTAAPSVAAVSVKASE